MGMAAAVALSAFTAPAHALGAAPFDGRYEDRGAKITVTCSTGKAASSSSKVSRMLFSGEHNRIMSGKKQVGTVAPATGVGRITIAQSGVNLAGPVKFTRDTLKSYAASGTLVGQAGLCKFKYKFTARRPGLT